MWYILPPEKSLHWDVVCVETPIPSKCRDSLMLYLYIYIYPPVGDWLTHQHILRADSPDFQIRGDFILPPCSRVHSLSLDAEELQKEQKKNFVTCLHAAVVTLRLP